MSALADISVDPSTALSCEIYPGAMSTRADNGTPKQVAFGDWVEDSLDYLKATEGLTRRGAFEKAGLSHTQVYSWMGMPASAGYADPTPDKVRQFCDRLGLNYTEAATRLGWIQGADSGARRTPTEIELERMRAEAMMRNFEKRGRLTDARRAKYEAIIRGAGRAYMANMAEFFEEAERDMATDNAPSGSDGEHDT